MLVLKAAGEDWRTLAVEFVPLQNLRQTLQFVEILNPSKVTWLGHTRRKLEPAEGSWRILSSPWG